MWQLFAQCRYHLLHPLNGRSAVAGNNCTRSATSGAAPRLCHMPLGRRPHIARGPCALLLCLCALSPKPSRARFAGNTFARRSAPEACVPRCWTGSPQIDLVGLCRDRTATVRRLSRLSDAAAERSAGSSLVPGHLQLLAPSRGTPCVRRRLLRDRCTERSEQAGLPAPSAIYVFPVPRRPTTAT